jgi:hypothetical protein
MARRLCGAVVSLLLLSGAHGLEAQVRQISGRITNAQTEQGLTEATVAVAGTQIVAQAGNDGQFTLNAPDRDVTLTVRGIGFKHQQVNVPSGQASVNVALVTRPARWDGLQLGVSLYRDRLTLQDTSKAPIDELIGAAHALYKTDEVELLSEWVAMRHHSRAGGTADMTRGWYAQASRRFRAVRPYVRFDYVDVPRSDQQFGILGRRSGPTGGVRWDFEALAAFKVQASHLQQPTRPTMNRVDAQVSFMF